MTIMMRPSIMSIMIRQHHHCGILEMSMFPLQHIMAQMTGFVLIMTMNVC